MLEGPGIQLLQAASCVCMRSVLVRTLSVLMVLVGQGHNAARCCI
jgi:hypothetical protein